MKSGLGWGLFFSWVLVKNNSFIYSRLGASVAEIWRKLTKNHVKTPLQRGFWKFLGQFWAFYYHLTKFTEYFFCNYRPTFPFRFQRYPVYIVFYSPLFYEFETVFTRNPSKWNLKDVLRWLPSATSNSRQNDFSQGKRSAAPQKAISPLCYIICAPIFYSNPRHCFSVIGSCDKCGLFGQE